MTKFTDQLAIIFSRIVIRSINYQAYNGIHRHNNGTHRYEIILQSWPDATKPASSNVIEVANPSRLQFLIFLYTDVEKLVKKLPSFLDVVCNKISSTKAYSKKLFEGAQFTYLTTGHPCQL